MFPCVFKFRWLYSCTCTVVDHVYLYIYCICMYSMNVPIVVSFCTGLSLSLLLSVWILPMTNLCALCACKYTLYITGVCVQYTNVCICTLRGVSWKLYNVWYMCVQSLIFACTQWAVVTHSNLCVCVCVCVVVLATLCLSLL